MESGPLATGWLAEISTYVRCLSMEFGMFHEFPSLPGRSQSEGFAEALEQVDRAEEYGNNRRAWCRRLARRRQGRGLRAVRGREHPGRSRQAGGVQVTNAV
jgi:hypothetical protein